MERGEIGLSVEEVLELADALGLELGVAAAERLRHGPPAHFDGRVVSFWAGRLLRGGGGPKLSIYRRR